MSDDYKKQERINYMGTHIAKLLEHIEAPADAAPWDIEYTGTVVDGEKAVPRPGIVETPMRAAKAWDFWTSGYGVDIASLFKAFEDGAQDVDQMVIVKDIPLYSHCEHHMAAIFGTATVAYIPDGKIIGLSKISRVVEAFARRLQVQERLTTQVADAIMQYLQPKGVAVQVRARHMCMESRGICQQGHHTITQCLRGVFVDGVVRAEFFAACNGGKQP